MKKSIIAAVAVFTATLALASIASTAEARDPDAADWLWR